MRDYAIIIPSCTVNNLSVCLEALKSKQPGYRDRVVVYDSDPSGDVAEVCERYLVARCYDRQRVRPFVFSRAINTCMEFVPDKDVVIMNDDAILQKIGGLDALHYECDTHREYGIVSSAVHGFVGNPEQHFEGSIFIRPAALHTIVFICVHIQRKLIDEIGPLDERLIHYGWEDNLYCLQARAAGYKLGVFDGCVVEHGSLPSTYRTRPTTNLDDNWRIFERIIREKGLTPHWPVPFKFPITQEPD